VTFGGLDNRWCGRRTPASVSGESRARERVSLREMMQGREWGACGAQKGTGVRGQAMRPGISACVRAGPRWFAGKAELTGRSHRSARRSSEQATGLTSRAHGTVRDGARAEEIDVDKSSPLGSEREWESACARTRAVTGRWGPPIRLRGRARSLAGPSWAGWAELSFPFFFEFIIAFLFIFSRVYNSNSNQVSNSSQIKHVHQFKEYFGLSVMQQFMTHINLTK
jgi:hypothetical protein